MLPYRDPRLDRPLRRQQIVEAIFAAIFAAVSVGMVVLAFVFSNLELERPNPNHTLVWQGPLALMLIAVVIMACWAGHSKKQNRNWLILNGLLIGLCTGALIVGACFGGVRIR